MSVSKYLFVDMEWNQKAGTGDVSNREPTQIALLGTDDNFGNAKLFSKNIRLDDVSTLTEQTCKLTHTNARAVMLANSLETVFKRIKQTFPKYRYVVVWTMDTYDLFIQSMKKAGVEVPRHGVIVMQDIISSIVRTKDSVIGFKTALSFAQIDYEKSYLHYSKHDVRYMFELYKKIYNEYKNITENEFCIVNEKTRIIHTVDCRYVKHMPENAEAGAKTLIFKGYRSCKCCPSIKDRKKINWKTSLRQKHENKKNDNKKNEYSGLPVTEENIQHICDKYEMKCNISDYVVFLTTKCGYWRIYLNGDKVEKVLHGNYQMRKSDFKKHKKFSEGFHQQRIWTNDFYDVVRYIYCHDRDMCTRMI